MLLIDYIDALLPGDKALAVPRFSEVAGVAFYAENSQLVSSTEVIIEQFRSGVGVNFHETNDDDLAKSFSMFFKQSDAELYLEFRDVVIGLYFSSKTVLAAIGEEQAPLFPRGQSLPEVNYDLLENVYNRGAMWRRLP